MKRLRIALITPLFPFPGEPYRGKPIHETALALRERAEVKAFCPVSRYPALPWLQPRTFLAKEVRADFQAPGVESVYRTYGTLPLVGRMYNGWASRRAIEGDVVRWGPDVILGYWLYPDGYAAVRLARRMGKPVVVGTRGSDLLKLKAGLVRGRVSWAVGEADGVLAVSEELARVARELGARPERVRVVTNGCDTALFAPGDQAQARRELGLPGEGRILLYVGHLLAAKGVLDLAAAAARLMGRMDLRLVYVGDGPEEGRLRARLEDLGVSGRTTLAGGETPERVARWLAAADGLCLPSYSEGCPNVVLEALSSGRPVVGSRVGAIPDLVGPEAGRVVRAGDVEQLCEALGEVLGRDWDAGAIAAVHQRSWAQVAEETYAVCAEAVKKAGEMGTAGKGRKGRR